VALQSVKELLDGVLPTVFVFVAAENVPLSRPNHTDNLLWQDERLLE